MQKILQKINVQAFVDNGAIMLLPFVMIEKHLPQINIPYCIFSIEIGWLWFYLDIDIDLTKRWRKEV